MTHRSRTEGVKIKLTLCLSWLRILTRKLSKWPSFMRVLRTCSGDTGDPIAVDAASPVSCIFLQARPRLLTLLPYSHYLLSSFSKPYTTISTPCCTITMIIHQKTLSTTAPNPCHPPRETLAPAWRGYPTSTQATISTRRSPRRDEEEIDIFCLRWSEDVRRMQVCYGERSIGENSEAIGRLWSNRKLRSFGSVCALSS